MKNILLVLCCSLSIGLASSAQAAPAHPDTIVIADQSMHEHSQASVVKTHKSHKGHKGNVTRENYCRKYPNRCRHTRQRGKVVEGDKWCKNHPRQCQARHDKYEEMNDHR
jgi:hypothetical protein